MAKVRAKRKRVKVTARRRTKAGPRRSAGTSSGGDGARRGGGRDEYSARGGMPFIEAKVGTDRSTVRSATTELSWTSFDRQVQLLARAALRRFKPEVVVGIVHGGVFVGGALASALKADFYAVRIARRSRDTGHQHPGIIEDMPRGLAGRRVLVVDDVAASGDSLELARRLAMGAGAAKVATAALVTRTQGYEPDFTANTSDSFFVFPWDYGPVSEDARFEPESHG